jgi:ABC-type Fe3+-siderophore transport system permease subunit
MWDHWTVLILIGFGLALIGLLDQVLSINPLLTKGGAAIMALLGLAMMTVSLIIISRK